MKKAKYIVVLYLATLTEVKMQIEYYTVTIIATYTLACFLGLYKNTTKILQNKPLFYSLDILAILLSLLFCYQVAMALASLPESQAIAYLFFIIAISALIFIAIFRFCKKQYN